MRSALKLMLYFLSFGVAGYAAFVFGFLPLGSLVHPEMKINFMSHSFGIYTHVFASILALVLGPFQFSTTLRTKHINLHRWSGRFYLGVGVFAGGLAGLYMSQYAFGGVIAQSGFAVLALLWLYTGFRAYSEVRSRAIDEHRKWMVRNFSLTLAAVTLRIYLPASMAAGIEFSLAYSVIAWTCWLPNLVFAEWQFNRKPQVKT
jgi:uncharacterized membrane protein